MTRKPIRMRVIGSQSPDTPGVLRPLFSDRPVLNGEGEESYVCGSCSIVLMQGVTPKRAREFAICCGACGSYNAITSDPEKI